MLLPCRRMMKVIGPQWMRTYLPNQFQVFRNASSTSAMMCSSLSGAPVPNSKRNFGPCRFSAFNQHSAVSRHIHRNRNNFCCSRSFHIVHCKKSSNVTPVFLKADKYIGRTAIMDQNGCFLYEDLLHYSCALSRRLTDVINQMTVKKDARVAFLCPNDMSYVVAQWATWMSDSIAVPLCKSHPSSELEYTIQDSQANVLITTEEFESILKPLSENLDIPMIVLKVSDYTGDYDKTNNSWFQTDMVLKKPTEKRVKNRYDDLVLTNKYKRKPAMIVYTSGTTGRPKGVVLTHGNLFHQTEAMVSAWGWRRSDVILHVLPLHHLHGILNVLITPLFCGATCVMLPKFDPGVVWSRLMSPVTSHDSPRITMFMAVPTIYAKLIDYFDSKEEHGTAKNFLRKYVKSVCQNRIRLMVSGSSSLPQPIMQRWEEITGHRLLERYGMSELGMVLSNPLDGPRKPGAVGHPLPNVEVCISARNVYAVNGYDIIVYGTSKSTHQTSGLEGEQGELLVKGPNVFKEYWRKPQETKSAFTKDGWFKTGDTVVFEDGVYKIIGRTSVDVIKSGGYKISALDVERHLLGHPAIADCVVVGLPDLTWGQRVAAVIVRRPNKFIDINELKKWSKDKMASYQIPSVVKFVDELPRNTMGKVNKITIISDIFPEFKNRLL